MFSAIFFGLFTRLDIDNTEGHVRLRPNCFYEILWIILMKFFTDHVFLFLKNSEISICDIFCLKHLLWLIEPKNRNLVVKIETEYTHSEISVKKKDLKVNSKVRIYIRGLWKLFQRKKKFIFCLKIRKKNSGFRSLENVNRWHMQLCLLMVSNESAHFELWWHFYDQWRLRHESINMFMRYRTINYNSVNIALQQT